MNSNARETLLSVPINGQSLESLTEDSLCAVERKRSQVVFACANPHSLVVAQTDSVFKEALKQADQVVADGVGVTSMARLVGLPIGPRITGHDYFFSVLNRLQVRGYGRIFFLGSSQRVLDRITTRFAADFPSLTLCGTYSPPFGSWSEEANAKIVQTINDARPDVLWVGMTAPKQEKWVQTNRHGVSVPVIGSIGAVFDFYAGTYPRSPRWICRAGLEWAYRFMKEPRRMWRRNVVSAPKFILLVLYRHGLRCSK